MNFTRLELDDLKGKVIASARVESEVLVLRFTDSTVMTVELDYDGELDIEIRQPSEAGGEGHETAR